MGMSPRGRKSGTGAPKPRTPRVRKQQDAAAADVGDGRSPSGDVPPVDASMPAADAAVTAPKPARPKRPRKAKPVAPLADASTPDAADEPTDTAPFADALAGAFLYTPEPDVEDVAPTTAVELPFIVDPPPRTTPPASDVITSDRAEPPADEWVDLVLAPTPKAPASRPRPPRGGTRPAKSASSARPASGKARQPALAAPATPAPIAGQRATPGAAGSVVRPGQPAASRPAAPDAVPATRWWLVVPVLVSLAILLWVNRPGQRHAPVPSGVLGTWTTTFWLYENQQLRILRDTVVVTLDEPEEGRYPITTVETADAGRETAVKIGYRLDSGDEKVLDFLADKAPTTSLRFRNHSGLVWVRADE